MVFCMCPPSINTNASFLKNHTPQDLPIESIYGVLMVDLYGSTHSEECKKIRRTLSTKKDETHRHLTVSGSGIHLEIY